ncbi:hypothetical protein DBL00_16520 [Klebsiella quasipneumoniae]|nr:hypothetical protein DBL00_16520 [Klebsiella quasipneumoniae]
MDGFCISNTVINFINDKIKMVDRGGMKYLILIASMMVAVPAMADSMDHETKAQAYVSCAFYGDMSVLGKKPDTYDIPSSEVDTFRKAALKEWRIMNKLNVINYSGDEEIINYAEYVASQEATLWEKKGMNGDGVNDVSRKYYHEMNCPLLLQTL